jgi:integrase
VNILDTYPVLDRLGIARTTRGSGFHAFRHAVASLINERTGDIKLAQKLLGHTNPTMTANVYTHTYADSERRASLELERAILGDSVPQTVPHGEQVQESTSRP